MPEPDALPTELIETGSIHISLVMGREGHGTSYTYQGVSLDSAIGHLTVVLDRMRAEAATEWQGREGGDD